MANSIEYQAAAQIVHQERVAATLAATGGEIIHPDHYAIREALRLAVLRAIDETTSEIEAPKMRDGELPNLFRALDAISHNIFLKGAGL